MASNEFGVTQKIMTLVESLLDEGYMGEPVIQYVNIRDGEIGLPAGGGNVLAVKLEGFCKESCHIFANKLTGSIWMNGRYGCLKLWEADEAITVEDIVCISYEKYMQYRDRGYMIPEAFLPLFLKYGYMETQTVTKIVCKK